MADISLTLELLELIAERFKAAPRRGPPAGGGVGGRERGRRAMTDLVTISLGLAFLAGMVSFLSPRVFPVVPSYVGFVTGLTPDELKDGGRAAARRSATATILSSEIPSALPSAMVVVISSCCRRRRRGRTSTECRVREPGSEAVAVARHSRSTCSSSSRQAPVEQSLGSVRRDPPAADPAFPVAVPVRKPGTTRTASLREESSPVRARAHHGDGAERTVPVGVNAPRAGIRAVPEGSRHRSR
jgi:hypothetical protein